MQVHSQLSNLQPAFLSQLQSGGLARAEPVVEPPTGIPLTCAGYSGGEAIAKPVVEPPAGIPLSAAAADAADFAHAEAARTEAALVDLSKLNALASTPQAVEATRPFGQEFWIECVCAAVVRKPWELFGVELDLQVNDHLVQVPLYKELKARTTLIGMKAAFWALPADARAYYMKIAFEELRAYFAWRSDNPDALFAVWPEMVAECKARFLNVDEQDSIDNLSTYISMGGYAHSV